MPVTAGSDLINEALTASKLSSDSNRLHNANIHAPSTTISFRSAFISRSIPPKPIRPHQCSNFRPILLAKSRTRRKKFEIFFSEIYGNVETFFRGIFSSNSTRLFSSAKRQYKLPCYKQLFFPSYHRVDRTCMAHDGYLIIIFSHLFARTMLTKRKSPPQPAPLSFRRVWIFLFLFPMQSFFFVALWKKNTWKKFTSRCCFVKPVGGVWAHKKYQRIIACAWRKPSLLMFSVCKYGIMRAKIS